jgi:hypothetical protein
VIIVENRENDWLAEQLLVMGRNDFILPFFKWMFDSEERLMMEKKICDKVNYLGKNSRENLDSLSAKVKNYTSLLKKNGLRDENIARKLDWGFLRYFAVLIGFPFFIAGYLSNLIPYIVPPLVCNSLIKDKRFYSSVYIGIGTSLYLIYFPVVMILSIVFLGWWGIPAALLVPVTGYLVLFYQEVVTERFHRFRFWLKKISRPDLIKELFSLRREIQETVAGISI